MSLLSKSIVQAFAESVAVGDLAPEAADALGPHLEVRLREIIQVFFPETNVLSVPIGFCSVSNTPYAVLQDASKFMRHSKRHTLSTEDINSALILNLKEVIASLQLA